MTKIRLKTFHIACLLLVCSWSASVNSKSNSHSNGNSTKGIIRYQQNFDTKLNHLVVDNVGSRVSFFCLRLMVSFIIIRLIVARRSHFLHPFERVCACNYFVRLHVLLQLFPWELYENGWKNNGNFILSRGVEVSRLQRDKLIKKKLHSTGVSMDTHDERVIFR